MNRTAHILIVEDSRTQALQLEHTLTKSGFRVSQANDGLAALAQIEQEEPEIIISDVVMPGLNGFELCERLNHDERFSHIPILLLTSLSDPEDIIRGLDCGASNFVVKPYKEKQLLDRIKYLLINQDLRQNQPQQSQFGIEMFFSGKKHLITSERRQILDLLFTTFEDAVEKKRELEQTTRELLKAYETIKKLKGLLPICSFCKKIRNDDGYWQHVEEFVSQHSDAEFSHGLCPDCLTKHFAKYAGDSEKN
jgi:two-component system cell cycle response regulator